MNRCALCCKGLPADDLAARDAEGRPICGECEQMIALRDAKRDRWAVDLAAAAILAAVCAVIMWFAWGCGSPEAGDDGRWAVQPPIGQEPSQGTVTNEFR